MVRPMRSHPLILATLLALAAPATAAAEPTLQPLKPCYVFAKVDPATGAYDAEYLAVEGGGFTPGGEVTVLVDGTTAARVAADQSGAVSTSVQAPIQERGEREFQLSAIDAGGAAVSAFSRVTALKVGARPRTARWKRRVTFRGRGFTMLDRPVFAHYYRGTRLRRSVRIGRPKGPCGTFERKRRQFPFKPRSGRWFVRFDQERAFDFDVETAYRDLEIFVTRQPRRDRG